MRLTGPAVIAGIFCVTFLTLHGVAMLTARLPYFQGACLITAAVLGVLLAFQSKLSNDSIPQAAQKIGLRSIGISPLKPALNVSAALLLVYPLLGWFTGTPIRLTEDWMGNLAGTILTGGIAEEALFRGFLFARLRDTRSFREAARLSTIVFTLAHLLLFTYLDWPIALLSTLLAAGTSAPFAYLFEKGGHTIWGPVLVHTVIRTIGVVFTATSGYTVLASGWMVACLVVPYLVLFFYRDFRQIWCGLLC